MAINLNMPMPRRQGGWVPIAIAAGQAAMSGLAGASARSRDRRDIEAARRAEGQRQAAQEGATQRIDQVFDSGQRQQQYDQYLNALRQYYQQDIGRQKDVADRTLRFGMARAGLTGGSAAVDAGRTLADEYTQALLTGERGAQASLSDLQAADEQTRLGLIDMTGAGMDATTAAQRAARAMRTNIQGARAQGFQRNLGDMFTATMETGRRQREEAARRRGFGHDAQRSDIYGGGGGFAAGGGR